MAYEVLARKWRPQVFDDVVGQTHVTNTLKNAIQSGRVAHAYLLVGPRGIGKTSIARILAKALNCEKGPTPTPCGVCDACREIAAGTSLDVIEFDAASNTQVDKVREMIIDHVAYAPARARFKVYLVDEVHMLSTSSFNALLKTLEEPPAHVKFIFATTDPQKVPATIISRCQRFDLRRIPTTDIVKHLAHIAKAEQVEISDDALYAIARGAEGGLRDAESALDQLIAFCGGRIEEADVLQVFGLVSRKTLADLAGAILAGEVASIIEKVGILEAQGRDLARVTSELLEYLRNLTLCRYGAAAALDVPPEQAALLKQQAEGLEAGRLARMVEILVETDGRLRHALSRRTLLEVALIRCARAASMTSLDEVIRQLHQLKTSLGGPEGGDPPPFAPPPAHPAGPAHHRMPPTPAAPEAPRTATASAASSPTSAATPEAELAALRTHWADLVRRIGVVDARLARALAGARPVAVEAQAVTIALGADAAADAHALEHERSRTALGKALHRVLGRDVTFRLQSAPAAAPPNTESAGAEDPSGEEVDAAAMEAPAATEEPAPERRPPPPSLRAQLLQDARIEHVLKTFDATIEDIQA